jgi:hypothetical protein
MPPLVVMALHQESAFCVAMLAAGRSNFCASGHVKRMQKAEGRMQKGKRIADGRFLIVGWGMGLGLVRS